MPAPVAGGASKAKKGAKSLVKGSGRKGARVHTKVHFFRPNTLTLARKPVVVRKAAVITKSVMTKAYDVIKHPLTTETAMKMIEEHNTLVFIVDVKSNKKEIKNAVKQLYDITALKVNTLIRPDGAKKAFVRLTSDYEGAHTFLPLPPRLNFCSSTPSPSTPSSHAPPPLLHPCSERSGVQAWHYLDFSFVR